MVRLPRVIFIHKGDSLMPKRFRFAMLCLLAVAMLSIPLTTKTRAIAVLFPVLAPIDGCLFINSGITSPSPGQFNFTNAFGSGGDFFVNLKRVGDDGTFNFNFNNNTTPGQITGGAFQ